MAWDHPLVDGIVRKVVASAPWMVVKDTHHHNVLKRTILSNTDWGLIRECPAPLFLVKPGPIAQQPKVFAAVDPMHEHDKPAELDNRILEVARTLAESADGRAPCCAYLLHSHTHRRARGGAFRGPDSGSGGRAQAGHG